MYSKNDYINIVFYFAAGLVSAILSGIILLETGAKSADIYYYLLWIVVFTVLYKAIRLLIAFFFNKHKEYLTKQKSYMDRALRIVKLKK